MSVQPCKINVASETGRLRAVLLRRPGIEIERMTPLNATQALYSDIMDKPTVDREYGLFSGVLERWTDVYYVRDILEEVLKNEEVRQHTTVTCSSPSTTCCSRAMRRRQSTTGCSSTR